RRLQSLHRGLGVLCTEPLTLDLAAQAPADPLDASLQCVLNWVVQQRSRTGKAGKLGDAGAHRARPEYADRVGPLRVHSGTSALTPVSARPMISCWICDVPSYR